MTNKKELIDEELEKVNGGNSDSCKKYYCVFFYIKDRYDFRDNLGPYDTIEEAKAASSEYYERLTKKCCKNIKYSIGYGYDPYDLVPAM